MRKLSLFTTAAALTLMAAPVLAQDVPAAPPAAAAPAPEAESAEEQAIEAAGEVFEADMRTLAAELQAAKTAAGTDTAKAEADADVIVARYQAKADAFYAMIAAFIASPASELSAEEMAQVLPAIEVIKTVPMQVRAGVMTVPTAPAAAGNAETSPQ